MPNKYRAYGHRPPGHRFQEIRLGWKYFLMMIGKAQKNSSPWMQDKYGLNKDATWEPKKGEGKKLRAE